jgi:hypothetical protein
MRITPYLKGQEMVIYNLLQASFVLSNVRLQKAGILILKVAKVNDHYLKFWRTQHKSQRV